ncbi:MAG: pyrroline-5-carboxylate reductase [Gammaproteobacteria bacterium]|jgi:pyrroline-5-carboxylate reductase|nr:pyrroline-5-carboxylate reductase [Gammaproteobacteria bacterium]
MKIAFIGGGNMAVSLIGGLIADGFDAGNLAVADIDKAQRETLAKRFSIHVRDNAAEAATFGDTVVLAIKPQVVKQVAQEIASIVQSRKSLIISIAAGIRTTDIERWLGGETAVVRAMPNTPALVQCGASGLFANPRVTSQQREAAETILRATGLTVWMDNEELINAVTALSGSGPAYFFRVMESLELAGQELGLSQQAAHILTLQTALGAAKLAMEGSEDIASLRQSVTSPGGTTEQGLRVLEERDIDAIFKAVLHAANDRAKQLADDWGGD